MTQRVLIPNKSLEEAKKIIVLWLHENKCKITRENQSEEIYAEYSGDYPLFEVGPRDIYPKALRIRLSEAGDDVEFFIEIAQKVDGRRDDGYIFWGTKIQELYEELGVKVDGFVLSDLFPDDVLRKNINTRVKRVAVIIVASMLIVAFLWDQFRDMNLMYRTVILAPIILLAVFDLQTYRGLLREREDEWKTGTA